MSRYHLVDTTTGEIVKILPSVRRSIKPRVYRSPTAQVERDVRLATTLVVVLTGILIAL